MSYNLFSAMRALTLMIATLFMFFAATPLSALPTTCSQSQEYCFELEPNFHDAILYGPSGPKIIAHSIHPDGGWDAFITDSGVLVFSTVSMSSPVCFVFNYSLDEGFGVDPRAGNTSIDPHVVFSIRSLELNGQLLTGTIEGTYWVGDIEVFDLWEGSWELPWVMNSSAEAAAVPEPQPVVLLLSIALLLYLRPALYRPWHQQ